MWAVILVAIIVAFLVYLLLTTTEISRLFPLGDTTDNIQFKVNNESQTMVSIGEDPITEDTKLTVLANGLDIYKLKSLSSFTVTIFLKVNYLPRTGTFVDCNTVVNPGDFDCKEGRFPKCQINSNPNNKECSHKNFGYRNLLRIGNSIRFELLETQTPQKPGMARAQISVQTQQSSNNQWMETYPLPEFPLQKWIMLSIVRKGNTYIVYYNDKMVGSFKTEYVPYIDTTKPQLGEDKIIKGVGIYLSIIKQALNTDQIKKRYISFTDTNGEPKMPVFSAIKPIDLCVSGNCFQGPAVKPANPFVQWTQEYS